MLIDTLRDVSVTPYLFTNGKFVGGIDASENCSKGRMGTRKGFRDEPVVCSKNTPAIKGRYLYAGPLWNHFGHILVDCIHRLWAFDGHDAIVFTGVIGLRGVFSEDDMADWEPPKMVASLLRFMGIKAEIIIVRAETRFDHLDVPMAGAAWKVGVQDFYRPHLAKYQSNIFDAVRYLGAPERIYYPRTHLLSDGGIIGSSYFEEVLAVQGFEICHPEIISLEQQFAYLLLAKEIVFDEGSSVHLTEMFSNVEAKMLMLPRRPNDWVFRIALGDRGVPLVQLAEDSNIQLLADRNGTLNSPASLTFYANPEAVFSSMRRAGLVDTEFDRYRFEDMEVDDLLSAKSKDVGLRDQRLDILQTFRRGE